MKKVLLLAVIFLSFLSLSTSAMAIPTLQLDISDGIYDSDTETVVATTNPFTLYALLIEDAAKGINPIDIFYLTAAVVPKVAGENTNFGSFSIDGMSYILTSDDVGVGTPGTKVTLPTHGIFPTAYAIKDFSFDTNNKTLAYNSQDNPGGISPNEEGTMYYAAFYVDTSSLNPDYVVHFDLFTEYQQKKKDKLEAAPFSHDAESTSVPVPEPSTMLLLGFGLIGLAGFGRKKLLNK